MIRSHQKALDLAHQVSSVFTTKVTTGADQNTTHIVLNEVHDSSIENVVSFIKDQGHQITFNKLIPSFTETFLFAGLQDEEYKRYRRQASMGCPTRSNSPQRLHRIDVTF